MITSLVGGERGGDRPGPRAPPAARLGADRDPGGGPAGRGPAEAADAINLGPVEVEYIQEVMRDYKEADRLWMKHPSGSRSPGTEHSCRVSPGAGPVTKAVRLRTGVSTPDDAALQLDRAAATEEERFRRESAKLDDEVIRQVGKVLGRKQRAAFNPPARRVGVRFMTPARTPRATQASVLRPGRRSAAPPPTLMPPRLEPIAPKGDK